MMGRSPCDFLICLNWRRQAPPTEPLLHSCQRGASGTFGTSQLLDLDHGKLIMFDHIEIVQTGTQRPASTAKPGQPGGRESWCPGTLGLGEDGFRPERIRSTGVFIGARRLCKQPAGFHFVAGWSLHGLRWVEKE
jgi:hypothetical protein